MSPPETGRPVLLASDPFYPLHVAAHTEMLVNDQYCDLAGLRISVKALQHHLPWDGVILAAQQEPSQAQAVLFRIRKSQFVMNVLRAAGFPQASQGSLNVFGGPT